MKRFFMVIAAALSALTIASAASAQEIQDHLSLLYNGEFVSVFFDAQREENFTDQQAKLDAILEPAFAMRTEEIDISAAGCTDVNELHDFLQETLNVEMYWERITGDVTYTADDSTGVITQILVEYYPPQEMPLGLIDDSDEPKITNVQQGIAHALQSVNEDMTDVEKALVLHDYIVRECDYYNKTEPSLDWISKNDQTNNIFKAEGVFVDRIAVCQGYAAAYSMLLMECGISSCIVASDDMNHAWNMVKLGDDWYHVDTTWDDPANIRGGFVYHKYFLKSDAEFSDVNLDENERHYGWDEIIDSEGSVTDESIPAAVVSDSYPGWAFREIQLTDNDETFSYQPRMMNYINGKYYTLMHKEDGHGEYYGNANILGIMNINGTDREYIGLDDFYFYMFSLDGKLYASNREKIVELGTDGKIKSYLLFEKNGSISNFWLKLDKLSYGRFENGVYYENRFDEITDISIVKDKIIYAPYPDGTASVIGYTGTAEIAELEIPSEVNGYRVTEIGIKAFSGNTLIKKIVLPETIVKLCEGSFAQSDITEIELPAGLRTIDREAFWNCNGLKEIEIPATVNEIGQEAFAFCYLLKEVKFFGGVPDTWGSNAFVDCGTGYKNLNGQQLDLLKFIVNKNRKSWELVGADENNLTWTDVNGVDYKVETFNGPKSGDFDGDGEVGTTDINAILDYFIGKSDTLPDESWADVDGEDGVTRKDAMILARYAAGWTFYDNYFK